MEHSMNFGRFDPYDDEITAREFEHKDSRTQYWQDRCRAAERRVHRLEQLLDTPENQRDAAMVIDASEECYQLALMNDSLIDQNVESGEEMYRLNGMCEWVSKILKMPALNRMGLEQKEYPPMYYGDT